MSASFPKISSVDSIPLSLEIPLQTHPESMSKTIEKIASYVSDIYTMFLKLTNEERHQLREKKMEIYPIDTDWKKKILSDPSKIEQFKTTLEKAIIDDLSQLEDGYSVVTLSTDNCPQEKLSAICDSIFDNFMGFAFPCKTTTRIVVRENDFTLSMNFESGFRL